MPNGEIKQLTVEDCLKSVSNKGPKVWSPKMGNGTWDKGEHFIDKDGNGIWNDAEYFTDKNELAPYKYMQQAKDNVRAIAEERIALFWGTK